ncbi:SGNH hydrolase-type esterase domain-containing protein [Chytriomyces sp. MP71]|nr:SGNH hydrolase-type esterase domain-containing protein [Chytriomyces sp. MP71]
MFESIWALLASINSLYIVAVQWLNQRFFSDMPYVTSRYGKFVHKLVIIGDDFAYGCGDTQRVASMPGLAKHLASRMRKEAKVKHAWEVFNLGVIGSTSADWLPRSELDDRSASGSTGHFERVFSSKRTESAEVVVVMVGFNDARAQQLGRKSPISAAETIDNIRAIVRVLRNLGKDVWVCTICNNGDKKQLSRTQAAENIVRNDGIVGFLKDKQDGVFAGPRLDVESYEFRAVEFFLEDGVYFTAKGYAKLSKDFGDLILTSLVKREFNSMKELLGL